MNPIERSILQDKEAHKIENTALLKKNVFEKLLELTKRRNAYCYIDSCNVKIINVPKQ